jgi:hypothetical protein
VVGNFDVKISPGYEGRGLYQTMILRIRLNENFLCKTTRDPAC